MPRSVTKDGLEIHVFSRSSTAISKPTLELTCYGTNLSQHAWQFLFLSFPNSEQNVLLVSQRGFSTTAVGSLNANS